MYMDVPYLQYSGKTLGGSSSINGGHWTRGMSSQYDAWSTLLESSEASVGWNWDNLWGYMKKVGHEDRSESSIQLTTSFRPKRSPLPTTSSVLRALMTSILITEVMVPSRSPTLTSCMAALSNRISRRLSKL